MIFLQILWIAPTPDISNNNLLQPLIFFLRDPLISTIWMRPHKVVSKHFKSCVRQCSSTNPSSSMRPDNIRDIAKAFLEDVTLDVPIWKRWDCCSTVDLQEIERLVEPTSDTDVPAKVCRRQFPKGKGSVINSMSVVTPNRSEMKHYGGNNITKGVATITGQCISSIC